MSRLMVLACAGLLLLAGCSGDGDGDAGGSVDTSAAGEVVTWGDGDYGVVMAHGAAFDAASWEDQATAIADRGATVVAVEDVSPDSIEAAADALLDSGIESVALIGGSVGADAVLELSAQEPDLAAQLILLSPNTVVEGLGDQPKLLVASEDEPGAAVPEDLAALTPGDDNEVLLVPGDAHAQNVFDTDQGDVVLDAILERIPAS